MGNIIFMKNIKSTVNLAQVAFFGIDETAST